MQEIYRTLLELQETDREIAAAEAKRNEFGPRIEALEQPVADIEKERDAASAGLAAMHENVRRMTRNAEKNRERLTAYEARAARSRNADDEAAARAEIDLIRRAVEADEQEAEELSKQITRAELKIAELEKQIENMRDQIQGPRDELAASRSEAESQLAVLLDKRQSQAARLEPQVLKLYERVRQGRSRTALAPLTPDGACGYCFNMVPVQRQSEIRRGNAIERCEACGVILYHEA